MSAPFNFPHEYGKLGNWPGSINANQAQTLLMQASNQNQGAKFVELGFDGGRTTIVLNWAASQLDASIDCVSVVDNESIIWFNRARILHRMNREKVTAHVNPSPFACDLLVINAGVSPMIHATNDWYEAMPIGGIIVALGAGELGLGEKVLSNQGVSIYIKPGPKLIDKVIDNVVNEFSKPKLVAVDNGTAFHGGGGSRKRFRKGDGADSEIHEAVVANEGS